MTSEPSDEQADEMYGRFTDGTISTIAGVPRVDFHRESSSLEEAIRSAIGDVRSQGFDVERVEIARRQILPVSGPHRLTPINTGKRTRCED